MKNTPSDSGCDVSTHTVLIPVTLSLLVPIDVALSVPSREGEERTIVDITTLPNGEEIVSAAMKAALTSAEYSDATDAMFAALQYHRRHYPSAKAVFNPALGLSQDMEI